VLWNWSFKFELTLYVKHDRFVKYNFKKYMAFCGGKKVEVVQHVSKNSVNIFVE